MDGAFSTPSYNCIGDPYVDCKENTVHSIKGKRQFLTSGIKQGQTGSNWGPGARKFIGMSGSYQEKFKEEAQYRLQNTRKNLKPNGFTYSNPSKKTTGLGDYNGSFSKGYEYIPSENQTKKTRQKFDESPLKRNIITSPVKKGTYGYAGTLIGGKEIPYFKGGCEEKPKEKPTEDGGDKRAFRGTAHGLDYFDTQEHVAASKVYSWDDQCKSKGPPANSSMTPKQRVEAETEGAKPWKPSQSGHNDAFQKFPEQLPEPYDERVVNRAMLPNRRNPVKDVMDQIPDSLKERRAFRPSNGSKTKLTRGTVLNGITKHSV